MNWIAGNLIGTDITGQLPLGNEIDGIEISGSSGNTIGGTAASEGNTIAFNTVDGIEIVSGTGDEIESRIRSSPTACWASRSTVRRNDQIPRPRSGGPPRPGARHDQIDVSYTGQASSIYLIQFFSTPGGVAKGDVEGEVFIGATTLKTGSAGPSGGPVTETFSTDMDTALVTPGDWITATVTFLSAAPGETGLNAGDTSEFSSRPVTADQSLPRHLHRRSGHEPGARALSAMRSTSRTPTQPDRGTAQRDRVRDPGGGLQTISLLASLDIDKPVTIITATASRASQVNNSSEDPPLDTDDDQQTDVAVLEIQVDGSEIPGNSADGLVVAAAHCTIDGLSLTGFGGAAIVAGDRSVEYGRIGERHRLGQFHRRDAVQPDRRTTQSDPTANPDANGEGIRIDEPE